MNRSIVGLILLASTLWLASCQSSVLSPVGPVAPTTATVRGTVTGSGQPLADFTVTVADKTTATTADGSYVLFNVEPGYYRFKVENPQGYVCGSAFYDVVLPETVHDIRFVELSFGGGVVACFLSPCTIQSAEWIAACLP